jgi:hypothetical protein
VGEPHCTKQLVGVTETRIDMAPSCRRIVGFYCMQMKKKKSLPTRPAPKSAVVGKSARKPGHLLSSIEELEASIAHADLLLAKKLPASDRLKIAKQRYLDQLAVRLRRKFPKLNEQMRARKRRSGKPKPFA